MRTQIVTGAPRIGRPSHYPVKIKYHEDGAHHELMRGFAVREGLSFAEAQRIINRAGIQALRLIDA